MHGIRQRLLRRLVSISVAVFLATSLVIGLVDYFSSLTGLKNSLKNIAQSQSYAIAKACWDFSTDQITSQLYGMLDSKNVQYAMVVGEGIHIVVGEKPAKNVYAYDLALYHTAQGRSVLVGQLHLEADTGGVFREAILHMVFSFSIQAVAIALIACVMYYLITNMITRHLVAAAHYFGSYDGTASGGKLELQRKPRGDELDALVNTFNAMRENLDVAYKGLLEAKTEAEKSEQRFRMLVEQAPEAIIVFNADTYRMVVVNANAAKLFGCSREELLATGILRYYLNRQADGRSVEDSIKGNIARALSGEEVVFERMIRKPDGEVLFCEVRLVNFPSSEAKMIRSSWINITERKQTEEALRSAIVKAEAANKAKSEFLANMSHEIRTPLNGILGMLQLLQTTSTNSQQSEYLLAAIKSSNRLTLLLSDLLDLSRMESHKVDIRADCFAVAEMLQSVQELFAMTARDKGLFLEFVVDEHLPLHLVGDETRVRQVLFNIVGNAVKFTKEGGVTLEMSLMPQAGEGKVRVLCTVSDSGIGIPESRIGEIFDPFTQVDGSYVRAQQGAGLGLSIVHRVVDLMGGSLCIDSEDGVGTTVYIGFVFGAKPPDHDSDVGQEDCFVGVGARRYRILLVEDEKLNCFAACHLLGALGHVVTTANDGLDALEKLSANQYDVILMDIQMPVMDGVAATRAIRASTEFGEKADIPIVAITAYAMPGDREKFLAAGMDDYVAKPFVAHTLKQALERVMAKAGASTKRGSGEG
ncbi:MAG: ATP-binding protein [Solidesulfovibrio sp.]